MMTDVPSQFYDIAEHGSVTVLAFKLWRLSEEENLEQIDEEWLALVSKNHIRHLVVDLSTVKLMTSAAIAKLIGWNRRMVRNQGQLVMCSLQPGVVESLETANLMTYFRIAPSALAAVEQFSASS